MVSKETQVLVARLAMLAARKLPRKSLKENSFRGKMTGRRYLKVGSWRMLQTHAPAIFLAIVFIVKRFRPPFRQSSTVHTKTRCMRFRFDPLSRAYSNRCVFDENAQPIVWTELKRPKRVALCAYSNENALVWTGPFYRAV